MTIGKQQTLFFNIFSHLITILILLMILPPVIMLIIFSFTFSQPGKSLSGITFSNYIKMISISTDAILNSLFVSFFASLLATIFASFISWILVKTNTPVVKKLEPLILVPAALSPFLYALTWVSLLDPYIGIINQLFKRLINYTMNIYSLEGIILVVGFASMPLAYMIIKPFFENLDSSLEEASIISGANKGITLQKITFKLALPTLFSAFLLSFIWCMEELGIPLILASPAGIPIASLKIYELTLTWPPNYNVASALAIVIMTINITIYQIAQNLLKRRRWITVGLRGFRREVMKFGKIRYLFLIVSLFYIFLSSLLPLIGIILQALSSTYGWPSFNELTLTNFVDLLNKPLALSAIQNSLIISSAGSLILVMFAFLISYIIFRTNYKFKGLLDTMCMFPLSIPSIVIALGIFIYFIYILPTYLYITIWAIMFGLLIRFIGHAVRVISPGFQQVHPGLEDAARISGASQFSVIKDVYLKLLFPTFISSYTFLFIYFVRELPLSILLATSKSIVWTVGIYMLWELGNFKIVMAFALLEIILILSIRYIGNYIALKKR
jgi:iron(III) transport system permease protein